MGGHEVHHGMRHDNRLKISRQPIGRKAIDDERMFFAADWAVVEVRGRSAVTDCTRPVDLDELEPLRNDKLAASSGDSAVLHGMLQIEQGTDVFSVIGLVYQHGAALHQIAVAF